MLTLVRVLLIEDNPDDATLIIHELQKGGFDPTYQCVETREQLSQVLDQGVWDIIISDYCLPQFDALQALNVVKSTGLDIPLILVSGAAADQTAVGAMRAGVSDYISKDNLSRLCIAVQRELSESRVRAERRQAREALANIYAELERRIDERTDDLRLVNERLSREIEERRRAEEEAAARRDQLQLAVDSLGGGFWDNIIESIDPRTLERTSSSYYVDPGLQHLFGFPCDQITPQMWYDHIIPEDRESVRTQVATCLTGENPQFDSEFRITSADRSVIWVACRGLAIKDACGVPVRWIGVAWNITERKQAETALQNAYDDLEERIMERTAELIEANTLLVQEVETRTIAEKDLRTMTQLLEEERLALQRKNIALKEILEQIRSDKDALKQQLAQNIERNIIPSVQKLKLVQHSDVRRLAGILEQDLTNITSSSLSTLKPRFESLSPREIEICRLIKNGLPTKEIADMLNLSPMTIQKHRETIRKKLGLTNEEVNLQAYLQNAPESL